MLMIAKKVDNYSENHPYELRYRFDFDETLLSVCNINSDKYDVHNLSDDDRNKIEDEFSYLKSLDDFLSKTNLFTSIQISELKRDKNAKYIDYVTVAYLTSPTTYKFIQFWETQNRDISFDFEGRCRIPDDRQFDFSNDILPCRTRTIENKTDCYDFRTDSCYTI